MTAQDVIAAKISEYVVRIAGIHWPIPDDQAQFLAAECADALTAAGYAIVKLPDQGGTLHGDALWVPDHATVRSRPGWVVQTGPTNLRPSEAVARAAALLAASVHAEQVTDD